MPQILAIAFWNVARTSPTLPPSAIRTSAMRRLRPRARQDYPDIVENRSDRRVRLMNGDLDRADAGKRPQYRVGNGAGRSEEHTSELQSLPTISYAVFC